MKFALITTIFAVVLLGASCGQNAVQQNDLVKEVVPIADQRTEEPAAKQPDCAICDVDLSKYEGDLKKEEVEGLLLALNDEYLAWSTYEQINRDFGDPRPFSNIQKAEGRHIERLKSLFEVYGLDVPENPWKSDVKKFESLAEACRAGIAGEIANRDLYTRLFESTERPDIITVYKALQSASEENHRPAFERCVAREDGAGGNKGRRFRNN